MPTTPIVPRDLPASGSHPSEGESRAEGSAPAQETSGHPAPLPVLVIRPTHGWRSLDLRELWSHRELLYFLAWRDVKVRYKQTVLGAAWAVLQPAMLMVVFTLFIGRMAGISGSIRDYPLFVFAGLLPWTF